MALAADNLTMHAEKTVILTSGGLRSLVATAVVLSASERPPVTLLHIRDHRYNAGVRREYVRRQAEHFELKRVIELELPDLWRPDGTTPVADEAITDGSASPSAPLAQPRILLAALAHAIAVRASRLVWPAQVNGDFDRVARMTEQMVLVQHLGQLEPGVGGPAGAPPMVETPLLELTDRQVIELGGQLDVPWLLAWTCQLHPDRPCMGCDACRRRSAAFEAAGMADPATELAAAR